MEKKEKEEKGKLEGLPVNTSPYTQYKDLEDYKMKGYGTQGHQEPVIGHGAGGSTDAPTVAGGGIPQSQSQARRSSTEEINRQGIP